MSLEFQLTQYPFRMGLGEGTDPHQVPPGTLTLAENAVWKASGRIQKRFGVTSLAASIIGGGSISQAARLFARGDELALIDGASLYAYSPANAAWLNLDTVSDVGLTWSTLLDTASGVADADHAQSGTTRVTAWVNGDARGRLPIVSTALYFAAIDTGSGSTIKPPTLVIGAARGVRVLILNSVVHIITAVEQNIYATAYDLFTFAKLGSQTLRADGNASLNYGFDAAIIGSTIVIAYENTAPDLKLYSYTYASGVYTQAATGGITGEAGDGHGDISIDGADGEVLYVCYSRSSPDVRVRVATANASTMAQVTAPVDLERSAVADAGTYTGYLGTAVTRTSSTSAICCWVTNASTTQTARTATVPVSSTLAVTSTAKRGTWGAEMLSRPTLLGSRYVALMLDITDGPAGMYSTAATSYLAEIETSVHGAPSNWVPHRYLGKVDVFIGGSFSYGFMPSGIAVSNTSLALVAPFQSDAATTAYTWRCGLRTLSVTSDSSRPSDLWRSTQSNGEVYLSGAMLGAYDGRLCFDYGAQRCAPVVPLASGAGSMTAGSYLYATVPEYRSMAGVLHRGPTFTTPTAVTTGASARVVLTIASIAAQAKQDVGNGAFIARANSVPERLALYRTVVNGTVPQRLTVDPADATVTDSALAYAQTYNDTRSDADISSAAPLPLASRPAIYTTGGILDDYAPPASSTLFLHADRLFVLAGDRLTWWYSKTFQDDAGVAPGFHPNFRIVFDDAQTCGASMDDKAVFFSASGVRYMPGVGPAPNGGSNDFPPPIKIQSDVGCTNPRSVVSMPDGVMFQSARGLYLLTRGLELVWIGRDVKDTLASYPNITSATLVAKHNQVRFTANNAAGTDGVVMVFDYVQKQWTTSRYTTTTYGGPIADACMWQGSWTFVTPTGTVYVEDETTHLDSGSYVPMRLETAWISAVGPLAFQSVREVSIHGVSYTDHDLTVSVGFDSESVYSTTTSFPAQTPVTSTGPLEACVTIGTRRKCATIRFRISDATPTSGTLGTGQGPAFDMFGLEVGAKRGFNTTSASKRG